MKEKKRIEIRRRGEKTKTLKAIALRGAGI